MNVSAALLAGGESRRMGQDKAMLSVVGRPLWERQLGMLRELNPSELFLSARSDPPWRPDDVIFVADTPPARGPLSGLTASLGKCSTGHLLVLAIDMPAMTSTFLSMLCARTASGRGVLPMIDGSGEPLAAVYPVEALPLLQAAVKGIDVSLRGIARQLLAAGKMRPLPIPAEQQTLFRNVNRPSDLTSIDAG